MLLAAALALAGLLTGPGFGMASAATCEGWTGKQPPGTTGSTEKPALRRYRDLALLICQEEHHGPATEACRPRTLVQADDGAAGGDHHAGGRARHSRTCRRVHGMDGRP